MEEKKKVDTVRCLWCRKRFDVKLDATIAKCTNCGKDWKIEWPWPDSARIVAEV